MVYSYETLYNFENAISRNPSELPCYKTLETAYKNSRIVFANKNIQHPEKWGESADFDHQMDKIRQAYVELLDLPEGTGVFFSNDD